MRVLLTNRHLVKKEPTSGQYVAVWFHEGIMWCACFMYDPISGVRYRYEGVLQEWLEDELRFSDSKEITDPLFIVNPVIDGDFSGVVH